MFKNSFLLFLACLALPAAAQDTLSLYDGKYLLVDSFRVSRDSTMVFYTNLEGRAKRLPLDEVFSASHEQGRQYFYREEPDQPSLAQMAQIVAGQHDGRAVKTPAATLSGLAVGLASPLLLGNAAPALPLAYGMIYGNTQHETPRFIERHDLHGRSGYYVLGFADGLRDRKTRHALVAGTLGMAASMGLLLFWVD